MLKRLRSRRPGHAAVVAYLALFVALGGTAWAIGAGTIGSREIRDGSIRSRDVRNQSLTAKDIDERRLRALPSVYQRVGFAAASPGGSAVKQVDCRSGDLALSGSYSVTSAPENDPGVVVNEVGLVSARGGRGTPVAYRVFIGVGANVSGGRRDLEVRVLCARRRLR